MSYHLDDHFKYLLVARIRTRRDICFNNLTSIISIKENWHYFENKKGVKRFLRQGRREGGRRAIRSRAWWSMGPLKVNVFNILTAGNVLKCFLSLSKGPHFAVLSPGLQNVSVALSLVEFQ